MPVYDLYAKFHEEEQERLIGRFLNEEQLKMLAFFLLSERKRALEEKYFDHYVDYIRIE